jgi:hypothetical protein
VVFLRTPRLEGGVGRGHRFFDDGHVGGEDVGQGSHQAERRERADAALIFDLGAELLANGRMLLRPLHVPLHGRVLLLAAHELIELVKEFLQRLASVADDADFHGIVLAKLPGILIDLHEADMLGDRPVWFRVDVLPQQVHADDEDDVMLRQPLANLRRPEGQPLAVERMVAGKRQPAMRGAGLRDDRSAKDVRDDAELRHRPPLRHAAAGEDGGVFRRGEKFGSLLNGFQRRADARIGEADGFEKWGRLPACPSCICTGQAGSPPHFFHLHIDRSRQKHGPSWRGEGCLDRTPNGSGQVFHPLHFGRPLRPGPGRADHVSPQDRLFEPQPPVLLARSDEQWRPFAIRVVEHPHPVPEAATDVQIDDAKRARGHRKAIRHRHHRHFLKPQDVLDAAIGDHRVIERQFRRPRVAEDLLHAEVGEEVEEGLNAGGCHARIVAFKSKRETGRGIHSRLSGTPLVQPVLSIIRSVRWM